MVKDLTGRHVDQLGSYTIMHVNGVDNKVVDCLSCYYENDTSEDNHSENTYVNADRHKARPRW